jgi:hypothetical protein
MSSGEFSCFMRGQVKREEQQMQKLAWHAANLMNCWVKKRITPRKLLGKANDLTGASAEEIRQHVQDMQGGDL